MGGLLSGLLGGFIFIEMIILLTMPIWGTVLTDWISLREKRLGTRN